MSEMLLTRDPARINTDVPLPHHGRLTQVVKRAESEVGLARSRHVHEMRTNRMRSRASRYEDPPQILPTSLHVHPFSCAIIKLRLRSLIVAGYANARVLSLLIRDKHDEFSRAYRATNRFNARDQNTFNAETNRLGGFQHFY